MADAGFTFTGGPGLAARLSQLADAEIKKLAQAGVRKGTKRVSDAIRARAPDGPTQEGAKRKRKRKSGKVRETEHQKIKNHVKLKKVRTRSPEIFSTAVVFDGAYHASYEEFGSVHNAARPFIRPAFEDVRQEAIEDITKDIERRLQRLNR